MSGSNLDGQAMVVSENANFELIRSEFQNVGQKQQNLESQISQISLVLDESARGFQGLCTRIQQVADQTVLITAECQNLGKGVNTNQVQIMEFRNENVTASNTLWT